MRLKDICLKIGSGATPKGGKNTYSNHGKALIRSQNVLDYQLVEDGLVYINNEQAEKLRNVEVLEEDVLLNITGDSVARACKVASNFLPAHVNQHVAIIRANNEYILSSYLLYFIQWRKDALLQMASGGATRKALTKKMIEDIEIDLPLLSYQKRVVEILDTIQDKINLNIKINNNLAA